METLGIQKGIWGKEACYVKCDCQGQQGSCWAWLVPPDPSHVQPQAL